MARRPAPVVGVRPIAPSKLRSTLAWLLALVVVILSAVFMDADWARLVTQLPENLPTYLGLMIGGVFHNPFAEPYLGYWMSALTAMVESLAMAWIGTLIGAALSFPLAFLASRNVAPAVVVGLVRGVLNVLRAVPEVILAIVIMLPIFGLGPWGGTLAIGVGAVGTLGKLGSEVIEGIRPGPVEALRSSGADTLATLRWGVLPQVMPEIVAFWLYRFEINIRASAILGVVGAGGIGSLLSRLFDVREWDRIGITIFVIILATIAVDAISGRVRHRIIAGKAGKSPKAVTRSAGAFL